MGEKQEDKVEQGGEGFFCFFLWQWSSSGFAFLDKKVEMVTLQLAQHSKLTSKPCQK